MFGCSKEPSHLDGSFLYPQHILGQKRNAAYKTYIVYGGYFTNLSQTICHSLSADFLIMSSCGCPGYHNQRTTFIQQFKPTLFIDIDVASLGDDVMNAHGLTLFQFIRNVS